MNRKTIFALIFVFAVAVTVLLAPAAAQAQQVEWKNVAATRQR